LSISPEEVLVAPIPFSGYLLALEGGGTRSQAALLDGAGRLLQLAEASEVNTNFVPFEQARQAVLSAVQDVLGAAGVRGEEVSLLALALVGARFGADTFGSLLPNTAVRQYTEREVIFARAGIFSPHGVGVVAATGATAFGVRLDDGQQVFLGGWGSLLGDEGSAYALGLQGLRCAARSYEGRLVEPTRLVEAVCEHFNLHQDRFRKELVELAYQKPLSRAEIAGLAPVITRLAALGDAEAAHLTAETARDLADLARHACQALFTPEEAFDLVIAGGLVNAGELILAPLCGMLAGEFPHARFLVGCEQPAVALGKLALFHISQAPLHPISPPAEEGSLGTSCPPGEGSP
jgi:N-acetylglucosamine kinase-like BadF-type ATPase